MMIPALKELTNIPIIFDPSHSTGYRNFVPAISKAAIAIGADGLIIEAHPNPDKSISDPAQAIDYNTFNLNDSTGKKLLIILLIIISLLKISNIICNSSNMISEL